MFKQTKKRQVRVKISFKHGSSPLPKEVIEISLGQWFETDIVTDHLWEGNTLIREYDWIGSYTRTYEYFYV